LAIALAWAFRAAYIPFVIELFKPDYGLGIFMVVIYLSLFLYGRRKARAKPL
jgi:hypothetical protein